MTTKETTKEEEETTIETTKMINRSKKENPFSNGLTTGDKKSKRLSL